MILAYNPRADYSEETRNSVLQQDPGPEQMQIEVIDDASPNGAPTEFIRKLAGKRVTVHCEPRNLGLAGIWNRCIERARGESFRRDHIASDSHCSRSRFALKLLTMINLTAAN